MIQAVQAVALAVGVGALAAYAVAFAVVEWVCRRQPVRRDADTGTRPWIDRADPTWRALQPRWLFEHEDDESRYR